MNLIIARNLLLVLLFITPVYSAIDQVQPRALVTTHSPYAYIAADDFDVPMLIFTLVPGQEYEGLMEYVRNNQYNNGFKVHCLFTILWNDFARTKEQLWNVYLLLGLIPHRFRSMYATVAFDLALHIGSFHHICESYLALVLKQSNNQHNVVIKAINYIYGYTNKDGVFIKGHGNIKQKYKILKFFFNIDWFQYWGQTEFALEQQWYYIKALVQFIEDQRNFLGPVLQYEAYEKLMQNDVNENRKEHAEKAYKCAAVLADIPKMSKIRDYALSFLGFDPSQW